MSEATLQRFLDRLNEDASFRESVQADPESAFAALGLSPAEQAALNSGDEDALRRLTGADVAGFVIKADFSLMLTCAGSTRVCLTPGSQQGCGTGNTHNCLQGDFGG